MTGLLGKFGNFINNKAVPHVNGLLGNPAFNLGVGLMANSGPHFGPKRSFGQVLAGATEYANSAQNQFQNLQFQRNALQQQQNQQKAIKQFQGLLGQPAAVNVPPFIRRPGAVQAQQNQMNALLAQINPGAMSQAMIQQQFAQPSSPAIPREVAAAMQMFPGEPLATSVPKVISMLNPTDPQEELDLQRTRLEIDSLLEDARIRREESVDAETQENIEVGLNQESINSSISTIGGIASNLNRIKGTVLQPGAPFPGFRRSASGALSFAQQMIGLDGRAQQELNTALDLVNKDLNGLILDTVRNFGDKLTVQQTRILEEASANENITPEAIAKVLETALDARVFAAKNDPNLSIQNQDEIEAIKSLLDEIKTFDSPQTVDWSNL